MTINPKMSIKIAHCIPSLANSGGMERVLTTKANYLAEELGYDVNIIITDDKGEKPFFSLSNKVKVIQLDIDIDKLWKYPFLKRMFLYQKKNRVYKKKLEQCLNHIHPDITVSLLRREINFLCDINDGSAKVGEIHFGRYKYREIQIKILPRFINKWMTKCWMAQLDRKVKQLNRFVVLTNEDASNWKGLKNIVVIPNPITVNSEKLSDCTHKRAIAVGRYTYQKGFDLLVKAWKTVNEKHPDWELHIYGGGDKSEYQKAVNELGLNNMVYLHGPVSSIEEKYRESSIFILSSRFEGLPLVLMEAMTVGLPSVAFKCPCGPKELIYNMEDGLLCETGNTSMLAENICLLIEDEQMRKDMGIKAAQNIKRFAINNIMNRWDDLFKTVYQEQLSKR